MSPSTDQRENRGAAAEIKFVLTPELAAAVWNWARVHLAPDPHASGVHGDCYRITSLYLDNDRFDVFHRRESFRRSKFRIRRYGNSDGVFLERKLKTRGQVTKRRTPVPLHELPLLAGKDPTGWAGRWYWRRLRLRKFRPVCQITYSRTARVAMTDRGPIRLTLDEGLRASQVTSFVFRDVEQGISLLEDFVILELKYRAHVPVLFKLLVEEFDLNCRPMSKYRTAASALGLIADSVPELASADSLSCESCLSS